MKNSVIKVGDENWLVVYAKDKKEALAAIAFARFLGQPFYREEKPVDEDNPWGEVIVDVRRTVVDACDVV